MHDGGAKKQHRQRDNGEIKSFLTAKFLKNKPRQHGTYSAANGRKYDDEARHCTMKTFGDGRQNYRVEAGINGRQKNSHKRKNINGQWCVKPIGILVKMNIFSQRQNQNNTEGKTNDAECHNINPRVFF